MSGGFSYPLSQLNRATQSQRQPGSAIKPLSYLAALAQRPAAQHAGERRVRSRCRRSAGGRGREQDYWTPKNYDGGGGGMLTLAPRARELAQSGDRAPARRRHREASPRRASTASVRSRWKRKSTANACVTIRSCSARSRCGRSISRPSMRRSPTRALRPSRTSSTPSSITAASSIVTMRSRRSRIGSVDRAAFYQLKSMLQGVLARGTARSIAGLAPYRRRQDRHLRRRERRLVRGLHQRGHRRGVGRLRQCRRQAAHARRRRDRRPHRGADLRADHAGGVGKVAPKTALAPPSPEAKRQLSCKSIDLESDEMQGSGGRAFSECFRIDRSGKVADTQNRLISRESAFARRDLQDEPQGESGGSYVLDDNGRYVHAPQRDPWRAEPYSRERRGDEYWREWRTPQRIDPAYIWGNRRY